MSRIDNDRIKTLLRLTKNQINNQKMVEKLRGESFNLFDILFDFLGDLNPLSSGSLY